jgi:ABC-2 type transport system permease protein
MRILSCFIKTFKENLRDWKILILVLIFAPFFVYLMHFYFINTEVSSFGTELFNAYIPTLLVLAVIMILFTAGASVVREIEKDTIIRLTLSRLTTGEFMTALCLNQIIIGLLCLLLTLAVAFTIGYKTSGSVLLFLLTGILCCFSVVGISIITASFIRTMFGLLTLGCFPFFLLVFFSDCFFPLPKINLFQIAANQIYLTDILPTAIATRVFDKILNHNSGLSEILFELICILVLSLLYFFIGVWLFKRKYRW